jgi:hypothetical protein
MKLVDIRCLTIFMLSILSFTSFSASNSEYGDIIIKTPEYKKITKPRTGNNDHDRHYHYPYYHHDPYYRPVHPHAAGYYRSTGSGGASLAGTFYLGVSIGNSEFDYDDIEDGDASIFRFGYRPRDSRLGYELSFFNSGDSQVTSLSDIEIQVDTINLVLTVNSSTNKKSRLNLFAQGGIYFADTTLSGPFDRVSDNSNGFLVAAGVEIMLNRYFSLRAEAYNLLDVEDFANDESISSLNLGGNFIF